MLIRPFLLISAMGSSNALSSALVKAPCCNSGLSKDTSEPVEDVKTETFRRGQRCSQGRRVHRKPAAARCRRARVTGVKQNE